MSKDFNSVGALAKQIAADLQQAGMSVVLNVSDIAQDEIKASSSFDVREEVLSEEMTVNLGPNVRTPEEAEKALEEETKGARPYGMTTFKLKNKSWLMGKFKDRGAKGIS